MQMRDRTLDVVRIVESLARVSHPENAERNVDIMCSTVEFELKNFKQTLCTICKPNLSTSAQ